MKPHNYVEDEVFRLTDRLVAEDDTFCNCDKCNADVAAYALAHLRPAYASSVLGAAVAHLTLEDAQHHAEITARVVEAITRVKANPRHS